LGGGGGISFYRLGPKVFDENGRIRDGIGFLTLAAHIWFSETHRPWRGRKKAPLLGVHGTGAIALLYNGVLGDRSVSGGNVLTRKTLAIIREGLPPGFDLPLMIYGERSALGAATLDAENIVFKQTPYDVKARR
jgi:adenine-specific DNA-methyltransferase